MAERIYGFKEDKCKIEVPSKEELNKFEIIRGKVTLDALEAETIEIDYPNGYTAQNCVPISCGILGSATVKGYNYIGNYEDSADGLNNAYKRRLNLNSENIVLAVFNPNTRQVTVKYKIVLMKINTEEYTLGDVNGDGVIDLTDLQMVQDYIMGNITLTDKQFHSADMNNDGDVTSTDYVLLKEQIASQYQLGDVNMDGVVNENDVSLVQQYVLGNVTLNPVQLILGDVNKDGEVTTRDAQLIEEMITNEEG